ncbi:hypothetical protein BaRGS_00010634, partial [Batillaria attramentaria]
TCPQLSGFVVTVILLLQVNQNCVADGMCNTYSRHSGAVDCQGLVSSDREFDSLFYYTKCVLGFSARLHRLNMADKNFSTDTTVEIHVQRKMAGKLWKVYPATEENSEVEDFGGIKWWYWKS